MSRIVNIVIYCFTTAAVLVSLPSLTAQNTPDSPVAPVPAQIIAAKRAFISNAGADGTSVALFEKNGDPNQPYNQFYAAMKTWGHFELVNAPADADLVFEIRFSAPLIGSGKMDSYAPQLDLAILDAKTHFRLWTFTQLIRGAFREATWKKNFSQGMADLLERIKTLAPPPAADPAAK